STPTKETACAQTEVGRSIEDLLDSQTASAAVAAIATTAATSPRPTRAGQSMMQSVLFDSPSDEMRSLQQQQQQQQQQLEHASRSISTSSLIEDVASLGGSRRMRRVPASYQTRRRKLEWGGRIRWRASLTTRAAACLGQRAEPSKYPNPLLIVTNLACLKSDLIARAAAPEEAEELPVQAERQQPAAKGGGSGGGGKIKGGGSRLATYEHSWRIATAGVCAVCEARQSRVCLLVCRVCHLTRAQRRCLSLPDGALLAANGKPSRLRPLLQPLPLPPTALRLRDIYHGCRSF
uniref:Phorbol-ester/DAG-type domain-containing protein n=1 Tax=Macrostomum lignano TaxID=282301 RepID=A0A1I8FTJ7_9PLAT